MPSAPPSPETIAKMLAKGRSPRCARIEVFQRYVDGTAYDGRPDFLDLTRDEPYNERKPCVIYPGVRNAIESFSSMCLGDEHFPVITSLTSEDDSAFDKRFGLDTSASEVLDAGIKKVEDQTSLPSVAVALLERAMASGTCVPVVSVQDGTLCISELDPKHCTPTFKADGKTVQSVRVEYRFVKDVQDPETGDWEKRVFQYLRTIDEREDVVYWPTEVEDEVRLFPPTRVQTKYVHAFGFCPVVWYRFMDEGTEAGKVDGKPIHDNLLPLIDSINFSLSARHGAAIYSGDPQLCEFGVDDDGGVKAPVGRVAGPQTRSDDPSGWGIGLYQTKSGGRMVKGRKKGKGSVWTYESPDSKASYLALPPGALEALKEDADDNISRLRESLGHVFIDPKDLAGSGDVSGKTLAFVYANQVAKCNKIRGNFGKRCLLPVLNMLFRVILRAGDGLYLTGADKLRPILEKFNQQVQSGDAAAAASQSATGAAPAKTTTRWFPPQLKLVWGEYFEMSDNDEQVRTANASAALEGGLITKKTAVEHVKPVYKGIGNVDEYVEQLEEESAQRQQDAMDNAANLARVQQVTGDDGGQKPSPKKPAPKPVPAKKPAAPAAA